VAARTKHIHSTVTPQTYEAIMDAANVFSESLSLTVDKLVQRGLESLEEELGSNTPVYIRLARLDRELKRQMSTQDNLRENYALARKLGDEERQKKLETLASSLGIEL
jgi:hypothetical protein